MPSKLGLLGKGGFLDGQAPSVDLEYAIRCDSDYLGKTIFKNFCVNTLGLKPSVLEIPLSKAGVDGRGFLGDARVFLGKNRFEIEIKFSHLHPHKSGGDNWAFTKILKTHKGKPRPRFDLAFCIGLMTRGPAAHDYWEHYERVAFEQGVAYGAKPHEKKFLALCGFYILPYRQIGVNDFRPYLARSWARSEDQFFSHGNDFHNCRMVWNRAIKIARPCQTPNGGRVTNN